MCSLTLCMHTPPLDPIELRLSLMNDKITEGDDVTACVDVIAGAVVSPFEVWVHFILPFCKSIQTYYLAMFYCTVY